MVHRKSWGRIVAIVILGLAALCAPASSQQFSTPKNVSNNSDYSFTPQLAVDPSGNIYVVWEDDTDTNSNILFSRLTHGEATFSSPKGVSNSAGLSFNPRIAVDTGGTINVVWQDTSDFFRTSNVFFSRSSDGGITFSTPINLSQTIVSAFYSTPQIAVDTAGNISVVWESDTGNFAIWFSGSSISSDGSVTFPAPKMLSTNTTDGSLDPQIAVDKNGNINVAWEDDITGHSDISFRRSTDGGATLLPILGPKNLSNPDHPFSASSHSPRIAVDLSGNINVVWAGTDPSDLNTDIFFSRSIDNGLNFSPPKNLSKNTVLFGASSIPQIAVDLAGNINVVWKAPDTSPDIFFARSGDGGATFSTAQNVSQSSGFSSNPWLTVDAGGNINVAWEVNLTPVNRDIFFTRSTDAGTTFPTPVNLSSDSGQSIATQMAVDKDGNLNVVWQDNTPGISQIFFSRLPADAGANQPPTIVTPPANQTVTAGQTATFSVTASGTAPLSYQWQKNSADINGATLASYTTPATAAQDNGAEFRVVVSNSAGKATSNPATLTVSPPECSPTSRVSLSPDTLWSPNHKLVQITATLETSDGCDANPAVTLESITSNEPDNGLGDGDEPNDIQAVGGGPIPFGTYLRSFLLRAERSGMGAGRVYTVNYMVRDASGNKSLASAQVSVGSQATEASPNRSGRKR